jgi:type VI secretion system Hcp family effector
MSSNHAYVKITGINGNSSDASHIGWIEITQVVLPMHSSRAQSDGASGGTRRQLDSFSFNKMVDASSAALYQAAAKNTKIPEVKLDITKLDEDTKMERKILEARFEDTWVLAVRHGTRDSRAAGAHTYEVDEYEAITMGFGKMSTKMFSVPRHDDKW